MSKSAKDCRAEEARWRAEAEKAEQREAEAKDCNCDLARTAVKTALKLGVVAATGGTITLF